MSFAAVSEVIKGVTKRMNELSIEPKRDTFNIIIGAYLAVKKDLKAFEAGNDGAGMRSRSMDKAYTAAMNVLGTMLAQYGLKPDRITHGTLVNGCLCRGDTAGAARHFRDMIDAGVEVPDQIPERLFIQLARAGQVEGLHSLARTLDVDCGMSTIETSLSTKCGRSEWKGMASTSLKQSYMTSLCLAYAVSAERKSRLNVSKSWRDFEAAATNLKKTASASFDFIGDSVSDAKFHRDIVIGLVKEGYFATAKVAHDHLLTLGFEPYALATEIVSLFLSPPLLIENENLPHPQPLSIPGHLYGKCCADLEAAIDVLLRNSKEATSIREISTSLLNLWRRLNLKPSTKFLSRLLAVQERSALYIDMIATWRTYGRKDERMASIVAAGCIRAGKLDEAEAILSGFPATPKSLCANGVSEEGQGWLRGVRVEVALRRHQTVEARNLEGTAVRCPWILKRWVTWRVFDRAVTALLHARNPWEAFRVCIVVSDGAVREMARRVGVRLIKTDTYAMLFRLLEGLLTNGSLSSQANAELVISVFNFALEDGFTPTIENVQTMLQVASAVPEASGRLNFLSVLVREATVISRSCPLPSELIFAFNQSIRAISQDSNMQRSLAADIVNLAGTKLIGLQLEGGSIKNSKDALSNIHLFANDQNIPISKLVALLSEQKVILPPEIIARVADRLLEIDYGSLDVNPKVLMKLLNRLSRLNDGASAVRLTELLLLLYSQTQEVYYDSHLLTLLATSDAGVELLHDFPKPTMPKDALELGKEFILPLALAASRDGNPYLMKIALTLASKWPARLDKEALQLILELCVRRIENGDRSAGRVELGLRLLGGMLKAGVDVERWVIVTMLRVLAENGDGSTLEWLRVAVMRAKLSRGRRSEEGPWLEDMEADTKKGGFGQETMEINLLLKCYTSRIGLDSEHKVGKIVDAINSMSKTRHGGSCKFTPDVWGWNEIVQVLALEAANDDMSLKRGGVWRVEALLNDMRSAGVEPNIATVTLCLAACRNTREILMWRRRVKDHWLKGRRLNSKWQSAVVAAFLKAGTIEEAEEFFITSLCMDISVLNEADWAADWLTSFNALLDFRARRSDGSGEAFCNAMLDWAHPSWSPPLAIDRRWHWPHIKAEMPLNVKTLNSVLTAIYHAKDIITRRPRREREQDLEKKSASRLPARVAAGISKSPGSESITVDSVLTVIDDCLGLPKYDTSVQSKYDRGKAWVARLRAMEVNPNQSTYDLLLKLALASVSTEDLSDVAFEFITDQAHNGVQLKPITFQIILESLSAAASQDRAVARSLLLKSSAWFHRMPALGVKHDEATPETYLALMRTAALASGDPAIALAWWERAHSEGVQLNECVAWRSVVMAWCIGGDLRAAASYAKRSPEGEERTGRGTDPATWCVVARAFMNAGKRRWALWCLGKVGRGNATKEVIETALDICLEGGKLWKDEFVAIKMWVGNRAPWKVCGSKDGRLRELVARKWGRRAHPLELGKSID